jgi:hypothetical protein
MTETTSGNDVEDDPEPKSVVGGVISHKDRKFLPLFRDRPPMCAIVRQSGSKSEIFVKEMSFFWEVSGTSIQGNQSPRTARLTPLFPRLFHQPPLKLRRAFQLTFT